MVAEMLLMSITSFDIMTTDEISREHVWRAKVGQPSTEHHFQGKLIVTFSCRSTERLLEGVPRSDQRLGY